MYIETLSGDLLTRTSYLDFTCSKIGGALVYTRNGLYLGGGQGVNFTELMPDLRVERQPSRLARH